MKLDHILNLIPHKTAFAHCDIPCGIYDVHRMQLAAHTVLRMTDLLALVKREDETKAEHDISRVTHVKEEHSDILEEELSTLQDDYFKGDYSKFQELEELFEKAKKLGTKARVGIDKQACEELLETVMQIAEIFYKSKDVEFARVKSVYPTEKEIVVQK